jgi:hypothetical protein
MANDTSTSQLTETVIVAGTWIEISIPDGGGGFISRKISQANLVAALTAADAQATQTLKLKSKASNFTQSFNADTKIESIDFVYVSGTSISVKVGTSALANDIISGRTITSTKNSFNNLSDYFSAAPTLYFTISGGAIDIIINYRNNYNS